MTIPTSLIQELRRKTDAPIIECKKALAEAQGDMGRAEEILRVLVDSKAVSPASSVGEESASGVKPFEPASSVEFTYKPSGTVTPWGLALTMLWGTVAAAGVAAVAFFVAEMILEIALEFKSALVLLLAPLFAFVLISLIGGVVIGLSLQSAAIHGRMRNPAVVSALALACSLIGMWVWTLLRVEFVERPFDDAIDAVKFIVVFSCFAVPAFVIAPIRVMSEPFCEECSHYMKKVRSRRLSSKERATITSAVEAGQYETVARFCNGGDDGVEAEKPPVPTSPGHHTFVECYFCDRCFNVGYLNIRDFHATEHVRGNETKLTTEERLVFSTQLHCKDVKAVFGDG